MGNQDIKLKHKVQLRKKVEEPEVAVEEPEEEQPQEPIPEEKKSNSYTWLWILLLAIVIGVIAYLLIPGSDKKDSEAVSDESTEVVEEVETNLPDSVAGVATGTVDTPETSEVIPDAGESSSEKVIPETSEATRQNIANPAPQSQSAGVSGDIEAEAMKVIRGDYGIGQERKEKLGDKYHSIQSRVNELKREGVF